jgi:hypothetical protein
MQPRTTARTLVLARNLQEFHAWCRQTRTSPRDRGVLYASGPHVLYGLTSATVIRYGNWRDRPDGRVLEAAVNQFEASLQQSAAA